MKLATVFALSSLATLGPAQTQVPEVALRGLTALRDSGYQAAVTIWTSSTKDPAKRQQVAQQLAAAFAKVSQVAGAVRSYDLVRVSDENPQSKRIYALVVYERLPVYLTLQAASAGGRWDIRRIDFNPEGEKVFPRELFEGAPLPAGEGQVPEVAVRGLQALREGHEEVALGLWTTTWPNVMPKEQLDNFRAGFAKLSQTVGPLKTYTIVRVFEVTPHLRRVYARLDYAEQPVYLMLAAYRPAAQWQITSIEYNTDAKEVFPPTLAASTPAPSTGALRVVNFAFLQAKDGPERTPAPYKPEDRVFTRYQALGFTADSSGRCHLRFIVTPFDPGGLPLYAPTKNEWDRCLAADSSAPGGSLWFDVPSYGPRGTYKLRIAVHDAVENADATFERTFTVEGPPLEPFRRFEVRDFRFSLSKDGPAEPHPVVQRGGTIYMSFNVGGMAFRGDRPDVHVAFRLVAPGGKALIDQPEWTSINESQFYHPPTFFQGLSAWVAIPSDAAPGTYTAKYTLVDRIANQTVTHEAGFEVR